MWYSIRPSNIDMKLNNKNIYAANESLIFNSPTTRSTRTLSNDIDEFALIAIMIIMINRTNDSRLTRLSFSVIAILKKFITSPITVNMNSIRKIVCTFPYPGKFNDLILNPPGKVFVAKSKAVNENCPPFEEIITHGSISKMISTKKMILPTQLRLNVSLSEPS